MSRSHAIARATAVIAVFALLSKILGFIREVARKLFVMFPELKKKLWKGHLWNPSYYVGTAGDVSRETIKKYIELQKGDDRMLMTEKVLLAPTPEQVNWLWHMSRVATLLSNIRENSVWGAGVRD